MKKTDSSNSQNIVSSDFSDLVFDISKNYFGRVVRCAHTKKRTAELFLPFFFVGTFDHLPWIFGNFDRP